MRVPPTPPPMITARAWSIRDLLARIPARDSLAAADAPGVAGYRIRRMSVDDARDATSRRSTTSSPRSPTGPGRAVSVEPIAGRADEPQLPGRRSTATPVFVRIPGRSTDLLAVDRANELHNTPGGRGGRRRPAGPPPPAGAGTRSSSSGSPAGRCRTPPSTSPGMPERIAAALRRLHAGPRVPRRLRHVPPRRALPAARRRARDPDPGRLSRARRSVARIEAALAVHPLPTVPCHNDLLAENYLDDGDAACGSSTTSTAATTTRPSSSATPARSSAGTTTGSRPCAPRTSARPPPPCSPGCACR